jgi:hypothetical protein
VVVLIALAVTIAAALAMLAVIFGAYWLASRFAREGGVEIGAVRWFPSPFAFVLVLLIPVAALLLWRFSFAFILIPILLPFLWRRGGFASLWKRRGRPDREKAEEDDNRPMDDRW